MSRAACADICPLTAPSRCTANELELNERRRCFRDKRISAVSGVAREANPTWTLHTCYANLPT